MRFSDILPVRLHVEEKDLILNETLIDPDLTDRIEMVKEVSEAVVVYFNPDELDDLINHIAPPNQATELLKQITVYLALGRY